jgi:hypothetical protein
MIRKQVYIEPRQDAVLKRLAQMLGLTEAEIIRRGIDQQTATVPTGLRDMTAWEREKSFIAERMAAGPVTSTRKWNRDEIYEERLSRYGRKDSG